MLWGMEGSTPPTTQATFSRVFSFFRFVPFWVLAFVVVRLLYETFFPALAWAGRPFPALLLSTLFSFLLTRLAPRTFPLPLLLNLLYLLDPTVNLTKGYLVLAVSVGGSYQLSAIGYQPSAISYQLSAFSYQLSAISFQLSAFSYQLSAISFQLRAKSYWLFLLVGMGAIYGLTMPVTVGRADTFEFQVVVPHLGIAHPTGYPLYLLLGKLWTWLIPFGSLAWRLNVGTAVFALAALYLLYLTSLHLHKTPFLALLGTLLVGLTPTFWSQAIEAEVYTLHALVVAGVVWLMVGREQTNDWRTTVALAVLIGLGMTNHLTTVFLIPPAILYGFFLSLAVKSTDRQRLLSRLPKLLVAFLTPLLLYLYLPLRWQAVNGEGMGFGRFVDWVVGGRFQGALQLWAWLDDPNRYEIIGRLFLDNWGWFNLALILLGFCYLLASQWRVALLLFTTWFGFTFYSLNYYVPDVAVFLIPAHLMMGICWASGAVGAIKMLRGLESKKWGLNLQLFIVHLLLLPLLLMLLTHWPALDRSDNDGLTTWGTGVLQLPLAPGAAILADSEKIAPLYYLQQAEGVRPDLDILVLPDETTYRAELDGRLAAGQTVYLARFLPGLEGIYHLRSLGPLTEVSLQPMTVLPAGAVADEYTWGSIELVGYQIEPEAAIDPLATAVTFYWRATQPLSQPLHIYTRWQGQPATSQHPVNNYYPTVAWDVGEIVPDFHLLPHPVAPLTQTWQLQAAFAPPFSPPDALAWQTVTTVELPATPIQTLERPFRAQLGSVWLTGSQFPSHIRPQTPLPVLLAGYGEASVVSYQLSAVSFQPSAFSFQPSDVSRQLSAFSFQPSDVSRQLSAFSFQPSDVSFQLSAFTALSLVPGAENGRYWLTVAVPGERAYCGWLARATDYCVLGEVEISGVPLPAAAHNFADKIALLQTDIPVTRLQPGGQLDVTLSWLSLAPLSENYTIFVQVVDANDRLVGQVDAWPRQGTHPTSQWQPGEVVIDPYTVQLKADLPPGNYRLLVGWYLLGTLQRLQVVDGMGTAVNDKVEISGLTYDP